MTGNAGSGFNGYTYDSKQEATHCCLQPGLLVHHRCRADTTCRSGFPIGTIS
jgi:hypothetical protein